MKRTRKRRFPWTCAGTGESEGSPSMRASPPRMSWPHGTTTSRPRTSEILRFRTTLNNQRSSKSQIPSRTRTESFRVCCSVHRRNDDVPSRHRPVPSYRTITLLPFPRHHTITMTIITMRDRRYHQYPLTPYAHNKHSTSSRKRCISYLTSCPQHSPLALRTRHPPNPRPVCHRYVTVPPPSPIIRALCVCRACFLHPRGSRSPHYRHPRRRCRPRRHRPCTPLMHDVLPAEHVIRSALEKYHSRSKKERHGLIFIANNNPYRFIIRMWSRKYLVYIPR